MNINDITKTTQHVTDTFPKIYDDALQPSVQNIGKALGTITNLTNTILAPIELLNEAVAARKDKFLLEYKENLNKIPPENVCEPNLAIAAPIIEHAKYKITETELRKKYAKLLSEASNTNSLNKPLLSFDNVLDQLSPYEIELLALLFAKNPSEYHALASIKISGNNGWSYSHRDIANINFKEFKYDIISTMISNYERLGLIIIDRIQYLNDTHHYDYLTDSPLYKRVQNECDSTRAKTGHSFPKCGIEKGYFYLTPFGESFVTTIII